MISSLSKKEPSDWSSLRELWRIGRLEGMTRLDMISIIFWTGVYLLKDRVLGPEPLTDDELAEFI